MSQSLRLAVAQAHTLHTKPETISALENITKTAAAQSADLILFPEAYLGGYPRTATFGAAVGARRPEGKEQYLRYFKDAVDLGDTPEGAGNKWLNRELEEPREGRRGDGTREELERISRETGVFVVTGLVERCGGTLYCGVVYVCPKLGMLGKRRKVMPTGSERLIWGQGQPSSLRAVTTTIKGVKLTLASAICWENYMPLLRQSLYSQNVNLYLAPTADARETWLPLMRTVALEGRCVVLSANQCMSEANLPDWIRDENKKETSSPHGVNSTNDRTLSPRHARRKSVITGDGHEIVFPESKNGEESLSERSSGEYMRPVVGSSRKSTAIDDGNEVVLPEVEEASSKQNVSKPDGPPKLRRLSTVTVDGHEIILPGLKEPNEYIDERQETKASRSQTRPLHSFRRLSSTVTADDGNEIALPRIRESSDSLQGSNSKSNSDTSKLVSRGGSCIILPTGDVVAGPLWDDENELLVVDVDFDDCLRGRLDLDVGGSYSRNDAFKLTVEGLDLSPPP